MADVTLQRVDQTVALQTGENTSEAKRQAELAAASAAEADAAAAALSSVVPIDPEAAYYPAPRHTGDTSTNEASENIVFGADHYWSRTTATGSLFNEFVMDAVQKGWAALEIRVPVTGTFSVVPYGGLFDAASAQIGANVNGTLDAAASEYVITLPVSGAPHKWKLRWSTTTDGKAAFPHVIESGGGLVRIDPATPAGQDVVAAWHAALFRRSGNLMTAVPPGNLWTVSAGSAPVVAGDGKTVDVQSASLAYFFDYVDGLFDVGDYAAVLMRLHAPATTFREARLQFASRIGASPNTVENQLYQDGEYMVAFAKAVTAAGDPPSQCRLYFDTRTNDEIAATAATVEVLGLFNLPDSTWVGRLLADPVKLMERLKAWQALPATVSSSIGGSAERTYATLEAAVRRGHEEIRTRESQRLAMGLALPGRKRIHLEQGASARASTAYDIGDMTDATNDAAVKYLPLTYDPKVIVEVDGSSYQRLGIPTVAPTLGLYTYPASFAAAAAAAGSYWYGTDADGLGAYIRPGADATAGKTWEVPNRLAEALFTPQRGADIEISQAAGAVSGFALTSIIEDRGERLRLYGGTWQSCGTNGWVPATGTGTDGVLESALLTDAGNDGYNANPVAGVTANFHMKNAAVDGNVFDGISSHLTGASGTTNFSGEGYCSLSNNGKMGCPPIAPTNFVFEHLRARGNRAQSLIWEHNGTAPNRIEIGFADIDSIKLNTTNNVCTGRIVGFVDSIEDAEGVTIVRVATV